MPTLAAKSAGKMGHLAFVIAFKFGARPEFNLSVDADPVLRV
jgi:hypothetical protein